MVALLVKLGEPSDRTLCSVKPVMPQVQVTEPPTEIVSTAGLVLLFRSLTKKILPKRTSAWVGIATAVALNVKGEPVSPSAVAVIVRGPAVPPRMTSTDEIPPGPVTSASGVTVPLETLQDTPTPATPLAN